MSSSIREWARSEGLEVGERGLIPGEIIEAYKQAHGIGPSTLAVEEPWIDKTPEPTEPDFGPVDEKFVLLAPPIERPLSAWLTLRDELATMIASPGSPESIAERIMLAGWTRER